MRRTSIVVALVCACVGCSGSGPSGGASGAAMGGGSVVKGGSATGGTLPGGTRGTPGAGSGLTYVYINSSDGTIYAYDSANWSVETMVVAQTGAFSISSGPAADTLYLQMSSYSAGPLSSYNLTTHTMTDLGGAVPGNSL